MIVEWASNEKIGNIISKPFYSKIKLPNQQARRVIYIFT
jgi:hypothetical protein